MDFSWVKNLADQANQTELLRQESERKKQEGKRQAALATCSFVEKLYLLIGNYVEEFNKHCMFPNLRVLMSRLQKRSRIGSSAAAHLKAETFMDETAYFTFSRKGWMYGIRGVNGVVEFVEMPVSDGAGTLSIKLDELVISASRKLIAELEPESKEVIWKVDDNPMDGPAIILLCQQYFSDFILKTNE